ncbi:MAG: TetR/AcrR family transcriptional regulator [Oscillospiraceae bacterium]|nr:TetR/AcrR family transcriptional regulator [Oscillospiraceae bacterium]
MNDIPENRRVRMTKRLMKEAMLELLEQMELSEISVTALCEKADVHRSTFYKYYTDPADLFRDIEQDFVDQIPLPPQTLDQKSEKQLLAATTAFFDYVRESKRTFRVFFSESVESGFSSRLVDRLCSNYITFIKSGDEKADEFIRVYIASGTVGMLREWVTSDFSVSSRQIAEMMYSLSRKLTE